MSGPKLDKLTPPLEGGSMDNKMIGYYLSGNQYHESPVSLSTPDIKKPPLIIESIRVLALFFLFPFCSLDVQKTCFPNTARINTIFMSEEWMRQGLNTSLKQ